MQLPSTGSSLNGIHLAVAVLILVFFICINTIYYLRNKVITHERKKLLWSMEALNSENSEFYIVYKDKTTLLIDRKNASIVDALFFKKTFNKLIQCNKYIAELRKASDKNLRIIDSNIIPQLNVTKIKITNEFTIRNYHGPILNQNQLKIFSDILADINKIFTEAECADKMFLKNILMQSNYLLAKAKNIDAFR